MKPLIILILSFTTSLAISQTGELTLYVVNKYDTNRIGLPFVSIMLYKAGEKKQLGDTVYTDIDGYYTFKSLHIGEYDVLAIKEGYIGYEVTDINIDSGKYVHINMLLEREDPLIPGIVYSLKNKQHYPDRGFTNKTNKGVNDSLIALINKKTTANVESEATFFNALKKNMEDSGFTNKKEAKNLIVNGIKAGKWLEYIDDSNKVTTDTNAPYYILSIYKDSNRYGKIHEYYKSGKLFIELPTDTDGYINGMAKEYYESGVLKEEAPYIDDIKTGMEKEYYPSGKLKRETPYDTSGIVNGIERIYYENGVIQGEAPIKDDKENGIEKEYYESGELQYETPYLNDSVNGVVKEYYETGKLKSETIYKNGMEGQSHYYDENGKEVYVDENGDEIK